MCRPWYSKIRQGGGRLKLLTGYFKQSLGLQVRPFYSLVFIFVILAASAMADDNVATPSQLRAAGWNTPDGASFQVIQLPWMGSSPLYCGGVPFAMDYAQSSVANADVSKPVVTINPLRLFKYAKLWQMFIVGRECGYVYLETRNEYKADCYAVATALQQDWVTEKQFQITFKEFSAMKRDYRHSPGLERWLEMLREADHWPYELWDSEGSLKRPSDCVSRAFGAPVRDRMFAAVASQCGPSTLTALDRARGKFGKDRDISETETELHADAAANYINVLVSDGRSIVAIAEGCLSAAKSTDVRLFLRGTEVIYQKDLAEELFSLTKNDADNYKSVVDEALDAATAFALNLCESPHLLSAEFPYPRRQDILNALTGIASLYSQRSMDLSKSQLLPCITALKFKILAPE